MKPETAKNLSMAVMLGLALFGGVLLVGTFRQQDRFDQGVAGVSAPDWQEWAKSAAPFVLAGVSWVVTNYLGGDKNAPLPFPLPNTAPVPQPGPVPSPGPSPDLEASKNLKILQALDTLTSTLGKDSKDTTIDLRVKWGGQWYKVYFGPDEAKVAA